MEVIKEGNKSLGQFFTPKEIAILMLDNIGYTSKENILGKHIIDNSCGNGAFLCEIVNRYCDCYIKTNNTTDGLKEQLQIYIHGIEIDIVAYEECIKRLNVVTSLYDVFNVKWNIIQGDALLVSRYNGLMDYVIGNPPYIKTHSFDNTLYGGKYNFCDKGMKELYIYFYELSFKMLNKNGKLSYITPNSWINCNIGSKLREYIIDNNTLVSIIDFGHYMVFKNVTTYVVITLFDNSIKNNIISLYDYKPVLHHTEHIKSVNVKDYFDIHNVKEYNKNIKGKKVSVKNGFATLNDSIFIGIDVPKSSITIDVYKASNGRMYKCLYPYDKEGKLIHKEVLFKDKTLKEYFEKFKSSLLKEDKTDENYYCFGRTQGINDLYKTKLCINNLMNKQGSLKLKLLEGGIGIYSGYYILINDDTIQYDTIIDLLNSEEFYNYIKGFMKYKSGGYYTFNTYHVEYFLNTRL